MKRIGPRVGEAARAASPPRAGPRSRSADDVVQAYAAWTAEEAAEIAAATPDELESEVTDALGLVLLLQAYASGARGTDPYAAHPYKSTGFLGALRPLVFEALRAVVGKSTKADILATLNEFLDRKLERDKAKGRPDFTAKPLLSSALTEVLRNPETGEVRYVFSLSAETTLVVKYFDEIQQERATVKWFLGSYQAVRDHWRTHEPVKPDPLKVSQATAVVNRALTEMQRFISRT